MANILDKAKNSLRKISDNVNKDKWDKNCINSALFTDPEPGKHVPPARQEGVPAPVPAGNVQPSRSPNASAMQMGNSNGNTPIVAAAPEILRSGEKPTIKPGLGGEQENKPVRFINPRFNRSINYVTSKVVMPGADNVRSLSDLPTIDPSQSISHIGNSAQSAEMMEKVDSEKEGTEAAAAAGQPAQDNQQAATQPIQQSAPSPAVAAAMAQQSAPSPAVAAAMAQQAAQQSAPSPAVAAAMAQQAAIQQSTPSSAVPIVQATMPQQPAQLPLSTDNQASAPAAAPIMMPQQPAQLPLSSESPQSVPLAAAQPVPVAVAPSVNVAAVQASPVLAAAQPVPAAENKPADAQAAPAASEAPAADAITIEEKCYYVLIKHTKTFPAPGSRVMMRNCDSAYAWTDEKPESERPTYKVCPNCGKTIDIIETEMD